MRVDSLLYQNHQIAVTLQYTAARDAARPSCAALCSRLRGLLLRESACCNGTDRRRMKVHCKSDTRHGTVEPPKRRVVPTFGPERCRTANSALQSLRTRT